MTDQKSVASEVYRIQSATADLDLLFDELDGEVTESTERLEAWLEDATHETVETIAVWLAELEGTVALCKAQAGRLAEVKRRAENRQAWAKDRLRELLQGFGKTKITCGTWTVSLRKGSQRVEGDTDAALVDDRFVRVVPESRTVDKPAIAKALKAGETVDGFRLVRGPDGVAVK